MEGSGNGQESTTPPVVEDPGDSSNSSSKEKDELAKTKDDAKKPDATTSPAPVAKPQTAGESRPSEQQEGEPKQAKATPKSVETKAPEVKKATGEGKSGPLHMFQSGLMGGWAKQDCKYDPATGILQWMKGKTPATIDMTKAVIREHPAGFFKVDHVFSITVADIVTTFRADKDTEKAAWLKAFAQPSLQPLGATWVSTCVGSARDFKPRFLALYSDKLIHYKDDTSGTEIGSTQLSKDGTWSLKVMWQQAKRYSVSVASPSAQALHICFNSFVDYQTWLKLLQEAINQTNYVPPGFNSRLFKPGILLKNGSLSTRAKTGKPWEVKHFKLTAGEAGSESVLQIRQANEMGKLLSEIEISDRVIATSTPKEDKDFLIVVHSAGKQQFQLAAASEAEKASWLEQFESCYRTPKYAFSLCEGYLQKRGAVNTSYQERYFVLLADKLLYYKNKADDVCAGEIDITKDAFCKSGGDEPNGFSVGSSGEATARVYIIAAETAAIQEWWVNQIQKAIDAIAGARESKVEAKAEKKIPTAPTPRESKVEAKAAKDPISTAPVELTEACSCGTVFPSSTAETCSNCGLGRPSAIVHVKKVAVNRARKKPTAGGFKVEQPEAVRVVQVDINVAEKPTGPMTPMGGGQRPPFGQKVVVPQKCDVEGCGKWEFREGLCKAHLAAKKESEAKAAETAKSTDTAKPADATKAPDATKSATKPVDAAKPADATKSATKPVDAKPVDAKPVDAKPVDAKPVDAKPVDAKPVDAKPVDAADVAKPADATDATKSADVAKPVDAAEPAADASKPADTAEKAEATEKSAAGTVEEKAGSAASTTEPTPTSVEGPKSPEEAKTSASETSPEQNIGSSAQNLENPTSASSEEKKAPPPPPPSNSSTSADTISTQPSTNASESPPTSNSPRASMSSETKKPPGPPPRPSLTTENTQPAPPPPAIDPPQPEAPASSPEHAPDSPSASTSKKPPPPPPVQSETPEPSATTAVEATPATQSTPDNTPPVADAALAPARESVAAPPPPPAKKDDSSTTVETTATAGQTVETD